MVSTEFLHKMLEQAKQILLEDGELEPAAFVKKDDTLVQVPAVITGKKYHDANLLGALARSMRATDIISVFDGAGRSYSNPEDAKYALENPDTEAPLSYPRSMRQETVVIFAIECATKTCKVCMMKYSGETPEEFKFEEPSEMDISGAIPESIIEGWDVAEKGIKEGRIKELNPEN